MSAYFYILWSPAIIAGACDGAPMRREAVKLTPSGLRRAGGQSKEQDDEYLLIGFALLRIPAALLT
jgi:hypothetical protein